MRPMMVSLKKLLSGIIQTLKGEEIKNFIKLTNRFSEWLALHTNEIGLKFYNEKSMSEPPLWVDTWSNVKIEKEGFSINPQGQ